MYPILAQQDTWFSSNTYGIKRNQIKIINILSNTNPTILALNKRWDGSAKKDGSITIGYDDINSTLYICGNGQNKIELSPDASYTFCNIILSNKDFFENVTNINGIELFETSKVTNMKRMFSACKKLLNINISNWITNNVRDMSFMFSQCYELKTLNVSNFNTSNVINMEGMFQLAIGLKEIDLTNWNISNVQTMKGMFQGHSSIGSLTIQNFGDISNWDLRGKQIKGLFQKNGFKNLDVSNWKLSGDISNVFRDCNETITLDCSNWDTSEVTNMQSLFNHCTKLQTIGDVGKWNTSKVENMAGMFQGCEELRTINVRDWNMAKVKNMSCMFQTDNYNYGIEVGIENLDVSRWNLESCEDMSFWLWGRHRIKRLNVSNWNVSKVKTFDHLLAHNYQLIEFDTSKWDTSSATNFYAMFHSVGVPVIDVSSFDTSKVTCFGQMFEVCACERIIGLENFDTSQGIDFTEMFSYASNITELNLVSFDTRKGRYGDNVSPNGGMAENMSRFLNENRKLSKITLGQNFSYNGDGTSDPKYFLTFPAPQIPDNDGKWYTIDGMNHDANFVKVTPNTYYGNRKLVEDRKKVMLINNGILIDLANAIRDKNRLLTKYKPNEMIKAIKDLKTI